VPKKTSTWINPNRKDEPGERELAMGKMRASGMTLDQIGATYGITRERVRQLLMKYRLDGPIEFKNTYVCITCGDRFPRGAAPEHRKTHRVYFGRGLMTPEMELRNEYIAEAYLRGDRIEDISRADRLPIPASIAPCNIRASSRTVGQDATNEPSKGRSVSA